ncbi:MAG TPA: DEAD/DEAH box helicase [Solirubrobacteraceae bacterium]|nr:DEAD/DEAH box helicase [Solirubrobacteraceae bacterium]
MSERLRSSRRQRTPDRFAALLRRGEETGRIRARRRERARRSRTVALPDGLHALLATALAEAGIERLYSHQRDALLAALDQDVIITTGTASGKSLAFNLPTLQMLCADLSARALYIYPTKALAQDQLEGLRRLDLGRRLRPAIYNSDTPREARAEIRRNANLILTTPDMLHVGILPNHNLWRELFANLACVVIDEAHVYRGVFGSHVGNVLRRLRRIAWAYGTTPRMLLASATIANPSELATTLLGSEEVAVIDGDGAPRGGREIALWNPAVRELPDEQWAGGAALGEDGAENRRAVLSESAELAAELLRGGARLICFLGSRRRAELLTGMIRSALQRAGAGELAATVAAYRAGYTPAQRRALEQRLRAGELRAVTTTNALELGIDIGALDAAIVVTFPGSVASLRQMWGRAGRSGVGLALLVAGEDALDQYFCSHPESLLGRPVEAAILDPANVRIRSEHLLCAAAELPLSQGDSAFFGPALHEQAERLVAEGLLVRRPQLRAHSPGSISYVLRRPHERPAQRLSLRSASASSVQIVDLRTGELLGTSEKERALATLHDGAAYLHMGEPYVVRELDLDGARAYVEPFSGDWYSQPRREIETAIERTLAQRQLPGLRLCFGELEVRERVVGYRRRRTRDHAHLGFSALELPAISYRTQGLWLTVMGEIFTLDAAHPTAVIAPEGDVLAALHALEHAQIAIMPLLALCDRRDIGGLSTNAHPQTGGATIFLYDGHPGGVGLTKAAFERFEELCERTAQLLEGCSCADGCPSCVQSPQCGNLNEALSKRGALALLRALELTGTGSS